MHEAFATPEPIQLHVENPSGHVTITGSDTHETQIEITGSGAEDFVIRQDGDRIAVIAPPPRSGISLGWSRGTRITIAMPTGSALTYQGGSSDLAVTGALSETWVNTGSGDIDLESVHGNLDLQTGSGDVQIGEARDKGRIKTGSGAVRLHRAGAPVAISTGSGSVEVGEVVGELAVKTGSGEITVRDAQDDLTCSTGSGTHRIHLIRRGRAILKAGSGSIHVGIPGGTPVWTDIHTRSGHISSDLPRTGEPAEGQDHVEIHAQTGSGNVTLHTR